MNITDILAQMGGVQSMSRELGTSETQAASGAAALIPAILGGLKKQAQSQASGTEGLSDLLGQLGGGDLLDDVLAPQPTNVSRGDGVLGQIFGSKDVSRAVAQNAASESGLDPALLKKMLPMMAMLVTGYMAKQGGAEASEQPAPAGRGGFFGKLLGKVLGSQGASSGSQGTTGSGLASMLDLNGDGNPLDDILRVVDKAMH